MAWRRGLRPPACLASQKDGCWRPGAVKEHKAKACAKRLAAEAMVDRSSPTAATTGPAAGRLSKLHLHICCSPLGSVAVAATGPDTGLHGLSEHERYFFETKGYLVVPDMLTPAQVDRMNEAIDQCPQLCRRRDWRLLQQKERYATGSMMWFVRVRVGPSFNLHWIVHKIVGLDAT